MPHGWRLQLGKPRWNYSERKGEAQMFGMVKVDLTEAEIEERTQTVLELLKEQEQLAAQVTTLKSRAKMLQGQSDTKALEVSALRAEIEAVKNAA